MRNERDGCGQGPQVVNVGGVSPRERRGGEREEEQWMIQFSSKGEKEGRNG